LTVNFSFATAFLKSEVVALKKGELTMGQNDCAHPKCKCKAIPGIAISQDGKNYCSDHCAKAGSQDIDKCECGHPGCA
jgi:hypothetical protein